VSVSHGPQAKPGKTDVSPGNDKQSEQRRRFTACND